jgi:uncharacterized membrane protein
MTYETKLQRASRRLLAALMVTMGVLHFVAADTFASIVPDYLPWHFPLVYSSGIAEAGLGLLLLSERTRWLAAWGCIALFLAVFPANIYWAMHPELRVAGLPAWLPQPTETALWLRLPLQLVLIGWALRFTGRERRLR